MCDKAVNKCHFVFDSIPDQFKTQEMRNKIIFDGPFKLKYCHDRHKTQEMCDKVVDNFLPALKFATNWFVTSKMIKKLLTSLYADNNILYFNEISDDVVFSFKKMGILRKDLNNINLDDTNHDENDPEIIIHIKPLADCAECSTKKRWF